MARVDQALSFHQVSDCKYELSGLRTGSVRDQILRAQLLVQRLHDDGQIGDGLPLVVVGGGAAGVAAAITACSRGVDVTLLEGNANPFQTQLGVTTRWLDPTEFDWPHTHWSTGDMSWAGTAYALPYVANDADTLALQWTAIWHAIVGPLPAPLPPGFGAVQVFYGLDARKLTFNELAGGGVGVAPWPSHGASGRPFAAAISCIGFSGERVKVASRAGGFLEGPFFWDTDSLTAGNFGIATPPTGRPTKALISGGGDGAQQDFLRILTRRFGKQLFVDLGLDKLNFDLVAVLLAEDLARRAHAWSAPAKPPLRAYADWHATYERLADDIWAQWAATPGRIGALCSHLTAAVHATWLVAGDAPGNCYGLNRLLALLVAKLHAHSTGRPLRGGITAKYAPTGNEVMLTGFELDSVKPIATAPHTCGAGACYGVEHEVFVFARSAHVAAGVHSLSNFDVIVIRHGVDQTPLFTHAPVSEQLAPFDIPA